VTSVKASRIRKKQYLIIFGVLGAITIATLLATKSAEDKTVAAVGPAAPSTKDFSLGVGGSTQEAARAALAQQMEEMAKRLRAVEEQNAELNRERLDYNELLKRVPQAGAAPQVSSLGVPPPVEPLPAVTRQSPLSITGLGSPPPDAAFKGDEKGAGRPGVAGQNIRSTDIGEPADVQPGPGGGGPARMEPTSQPRGGNRFVDDEPLTPNRADGRTFETFITPGTFCRAVMLIGMDAPTGGQSQGNPVPGELEILEDCQMPNGRKAPLKGCFVTVNGYGELSSERAYMRTDRLSCIDNDNAAVDIAIRGYVVGEDGKTGLRGPLVSKQGAAIANSINAALAAGIGRAIVAGSVDNVVVTPSSEFQAGAGASLNRGFDQISQYYLDLADQMYPTVSISSMRVVNISFSRGFQFERRVPTKE
jgi:conjugal transfer pilus assembly protein TraB